MNIKEGVEGFAKNTARSDSSKGEPKVEVSAKKP